MTTGKTPLAGWLADAITEHKGKHGTRTVAGVSGLLFATTTGTLFTHENFCHHWQKIMKKLHLGYKPHHLRHFFASTMLLWPLAARSWR